MELIANFLLGAAALGVAVYCHVLSRRLAAFNRLENGIGGAVAVLSAQVDDMTRALAAARSAAQESADTLAAVTIRAEAAAAKLELLLASLHGLPETAPDGHDRRRVLRRRSGGAEPRGEAA